MKAREAALHALLRVETESAYTNLTLQQVFRKQEMEPREKALATEIVYGTIQRQRTLDALLTPLLNRRITKVEPVVRVLLRMSLYQLAFLDKVPTYAVLNEAVSLCKQSLPRASGFVNAVLRSYLRDTRPWQERLHLPERLVTADDLGLFYSYPTWLVERLLRAYGENRTKLMLAACNQKATLSVRVNPLRTTRERVLEQTSMKFGDVAKPSTLYADGIRFERGLDVEGWEEYQSGHVTVQDEGAMLIAPLLSPAPGDRVLDMCAAPGSKTTHLAELMHDQGVVVGCDMHAHKVKLIRQAAGRLHLDSVHTATADARLLPDMPMYAQGFDKILLDAPCSGLGVLRHRPDIRWRRSEEDIRSLTVLQQQLLQAAVRLVKPGGAIVYSTCTLLPDENASVVEQVVGESKRTIRVERIADFRPVEQLEAHLAAEETGFTLTPEMLDTDGFYMVRLRID